MLKRAGFIGRTFSIVNLPVTKYYREFVDKKYRAINDRDYQILNYFVVDYSDDYYYHITHFNKNGAKEFTEKLNDDIDW